MTPTRPPQADEPRSRIILEHEIPHSRATRVAGTEEAIMEVLASGQHAGGAVRRRFEADLARRVGVPHGVAVQSGTAALHLALLCLGVGRGDRVLIPSYVCASLLHSIDAVGARPVVADVEERFFNLSPETARAALLREGLDESDVACAIVPHCHGFPALLDRTLQGWKALLEQMATVPVQHDDRSERARRIPMFRFH